MGSWLIVVILSLFLFCKFSVQIGHDCDRFPCIVSDDPVCAKSWKTDELKYFNNSCEIFKDFCKFSTEWEIQGMSACGSQGLVPGQMHLRDEKAAAAWDKDIEAILNRTNAS